MWAAGSGAIRASDPYPTLLRKRFPGAQGPCGAPRAIFLFASNSPACRGASAGCDDGVGQGRLLRHMLIAPAGKPQGVIAKTDWRIFCGIIGRAAGRQAFDNSVVIGIAKEWDGITHLARDVAHPVRRRQKALIRPAMQDVAAIDDVGG